MTNKYTLFTSSYNDKTKVLDITWPGKTDLSPFTLVSLTNLHIDNIDSVQETNFCRISSNLISPSVFNPSQEVCCVAYQEKDSELNNLELGDSSGMLIHVKHLLTF